MIDKQDFYWGAALIRLLDNPGCLALTKNQFGYLVNSSQLVLLKYSTKSRSPWQFTFGIDEIANLKKTSDRYSLVVIGLICGGDGVCAITWTQANFLLMGKSGAISVRRKFHEHYGVSGSAGELDHKISIRNWPAILFWNDINRHP